VATRPKRGAGAGPRGGGIPAGVNNVTGTQFAPHLGRQASPHPIVWDSANYGATSVNITGPVSDGSLAGMLSRMVDEMINTVAAQAYADVMQNLNSSIQFPTPYYETQITVQDLKGDTVVHDRGIIYGPWLEGVSRRNGATRFKGYHSFRKAADELRRKVPDLCQHVADQWMPRLNGS
jgi:hypothetical protein